MSNPSLCFSAFTFWCLLLPSDIHYERLDVRFGNRGSLLLLFCVCLSLQTYITNGWMSDLVIVVLWFHFLFLLVPPGIHYERLDVGFGHRGGRDQPVSNPSLCFSVLHFFFSFCFSFRHTLRTAGCRIWSSWWPRPTRRREDRPPCLFFWSTPRWLDSPRETR